LIFLYDAGNRCGDVLAGHAEGFAFAYIGCRRAFDVQRSHKAQYIQLAQDLDGRIISAGFLDIVPAAVLRLIPFGKKRLSELDPLELKCPRYCR